MGYTFYFEYVDEDMEAVFPDYELQSTFTEFKMGLDPVYEFVKNFSSDSE